jgi:eukaryotic-like serine/threonine-protein kinase
MSGKDEDDPDLERLAAAVAEDQPIDWRTETFRRPELASLMAELRVVENIRTIHRAGAAVEDGLVAQQEAAQPKPAILPPEDSPAATRWGRLELRGQIGSGGTAEVFRAYDPRLDTEVALKLRRADRMAGDAAGFRILEEGRRMARIRHPHVLTVHGAARHDGQIGVWSELIEGHTLEQRLSSQGPLNAEEATAVGVDLCRALAAVHGAGLVHRDVKSTNVMRERLGRIVLMDFGAGAERSPGRGSEPFEDGTPLWMAPEQLAGRPSTAATDLYALGVLLYRLVSGRFPIEAKTWEELHGLHRRGEHVPLRDRRPDLPPAFVGVVERALQSRPEDRFASAGAFERALVSLDPSLREPQAVPKPSARRTAVIGLVALLMVVAAVVLVRNRWPGNRGTKSSSASGAAAPLTPAPMSGLRDNQPIPTSGAGAGNVMSEAGPAIATAVLLRERDGGIQALAPADPIHPGDGLFLNFKASEPMHVYVLDEDAEGEVFVLFPASGLDLANPLAPNVLHRLPGTRDGRSWNWQVTSSGGRETVIVIATRQPYAALEREIAGFPRASPGRPVVYEPVGEKALATLRGIGGMSESQSPAAPQGTARLSDVLRTLTGRPAANAPWTWQIELENPR